MIIVELPLILILTLIDAREPYYTSSIHAPFSRDITG